MPTAMVASADHGTSPHHVQVHLQGNGSPRRQQPSRLELDVIRRQRAAMTRRTSYSDVVHGMKCVAPIKVFQYCWNVLVILLGLGLLFSGLYFLYYQENAHMVPALAYNLATYTGLALALISILGLYGLQRHRYCITKGKRNYALGCFILLSLVAASIIIGGGVIGLTLRQVADHAEASDFDQPRVKYFEEAVLTLLESYVKDDPGGWRGWQNSMYCCAYASVDEMKTHWKNQDDVDTLYRVQTINSVPGTFCAKKASECVGNVLPCPAKGRKWCRVEVLSLIVDNYSFLGIYAIVIGSCQLFSVCLALFTLMCDVRMLNARSPTLEIAHKVLSPLRRKQAPVDD
ncbi:hypothetical protein PINS_up005552 [Pythium insidiosum]|nr:hypothetical protein PINS_up005552 [Pythium insidiosum]